MEPVSRTVSTVLPRNTIHGNVYEPFVPFDQRKPADKKSVSQNLSIKSQCVPPVDAIHPADVTPIVAIDLSQNHAAHNKEPPAPNADQELKENDDNVHNSAPNMDHIEPTFHHTHDNAKNRNHEQPAASSSEVVSSAPSPVASEPVATTPTPVVPVEVTSVSDVPAFLETTTEEKEEKVTGSAKSSFFEDAKTVVGGCSLR